MSATFRLRSSSKPPPPQTTRYSINTSCWSTEHERERVSRERILSVWMRANNLRTYSRQLQRDPPMLQELEGGAAYALTLRSIGRNLTLLKNSEDETAARLSHGSSTDIGNLFMKLPRIQLQPCINVTRPPTLSSGMPARRWKRFQGHRISSRGDVTPPPTPPSLDSLITLTRLKI